MASKKAAGAAAPAEPTPEPAPEPDAPTEPTVAVPAALLELVRSILARLEHGTARRSDLRPCCPICDKVQPQDPANPREWELHAPGCDLGQALDGLKAV